MAEKFNAQDATVISFDIWHTLFVSDGKSFKNARNDLLREAIAPDTTLATFNTHVSAVDKAIDKQVEANGIEVPFAGRVEQVCKSLGSRSLTAAEVEVIYQAQGELIKKYPPVFIDPATPELLAACAKKARLAIISNTGFIHGEQMRSVLQLRGIADMFSHLYFSNEVGFSKPDARIFESLVRDTGVKPREIVHIGDNPNADVKGAQEAGLQTVHLPRGQKITDVLQVVE